MRPRWQRVLIGAAVLGLLAALPAAEPADEGYSPVAAPQAVHAALQSTLDTVRDWLGRKDFASAARDAEGVAALADLQAHQGTDPGWRERAATLADTAGRLAAAARGKDAAGCDRLARECTRLLDDLAGRSPGPRAKELGFRPRGGTMTWMTLLEAAYSDAKTAGDGREMELLAQAVAEEANAVYYLRPGTAWRHSALDLRGAALEAAARAHANDQGAARAALKGVRRRCDQCHEESRRR
jgi:hypothetical protein